MAASTSHLSSAELGQWNTTTRLLASLLNDHMILATPSQLHGGPGLTLHGKQSEPDLESPAIWIGLSDAGQLRLVTENIKDNAAVFPGDFAPPALITTLGAPEKGSELNLHPAHLFNSLRPVLPPVDDARWDEVCRELTNSAENGRYWSDWYSSRKPLSFKSTRLEWEQALYTGHPLHPVSKLLVCCETFVSSTISEQYQSTKADRSNTDASQLQNGRMVHAQDPS